MTLATLRLTARTLGRLSPALAARWAERLFFTPRRHVAGARAQAVLQQGRPRTLELVGERLRVWSWGEGPRVLLLHGWSGSAGQLTAFVGPLVEAGFSCVAFDAPAHGESTGTRTNLPAFADAALAVGRATGGPVAVIAHSMGAAAVAAALRSGLPATRAVLLAPPADPRVVLREFADFLHLPHVVLERMVARFEAQRGEPLAHYSVPDLAGALGHVAAQVVHDRQDREVPFAAGAQVAAAWPGARLLSTEGLGHNRLLYAPQVVQGAVEFLKRGLEQEQALLPLGSPSVPGPRALAANG
ncbi:MULTISPECIES: alpha/beta fold hydrolase [Myxococcaceae]|uniref:alpha/beta fold hydrolase n=1 Tax=Myxococcaceae TaxID=31 RepID=UPI00188E0807|nr:MULTISPECIES: alpha/beta fold hydrolase [Myxococcaceae]MBF5046268.1 alpha/beta fold hydrolase [Simulacricoccus sp. 17bor-14]